MLSRVVLSLGANLGEKEENFKRCEELIEANLGEIVCSSKYYESQPWGFESSDTFLNSVIIIESSLKPEEMLIKIWDIEKSFGRVREGVDKEKEKYDKRNKSQKPTYMSRYMDVDILFWDDRVINTPLLAIPHPLVDKRLFVLEPLCEIIADYTHPQLNKKLGDLYNKLTNSVD